MSLHFVLVVVGVAALVFLGLWVVLTRFYRAVDQGQALVVNKMNQAPEVAFTGALVLPVVHRAEVMDLSLKSVTLERRGGDGVLCADGVRADVDVTFLLRVNNTVRDVLEVAQTIGCARASDPETLQELFGARFSEALEFFCSEVEFERLHAHRGTFVAGLIDEVGADLNGYVLEGVTIEHLDRTPLSDLDPHNIDDAYAIEKLREAEAAATEKLREAEAAATEKLRRTARQGVADAHTAAYARATLEAQLAQAREDGYSVGEEGRAGAEEEVEPGATLPCPRCNGEAQGASCAACGLSLVLAGRYQLRRVVGFGSSGGVYEATDPEGRLVAVKLLRLGTHIDRQARTHFIRGAEVLRQLEHPLLPRVEAFEEDEIGSLVLVREYFAGGSLHERVTERSWRLEGGELRRLTERLLELLGYLHGRVPPVIHRDIKPRNLLCRNASGRLGPDEPVLVDFDSVAATGETTEETIVVSAGYTAPEQLAGAATPASDLYSLGATLLFLATHVEPDELLRDADGRLQIGDRLDHLDAPLRGVLLRLVEPDRRQRF